MKLPTFVLDLAGNHNCDIDHGLAIIRAHAAVVQRHGVSAAIKFQWRDLKHYAHGDAVYAEKFKRIDLGKQERLIDEVRKLGLLVAATAFDPSAARWLGLADIAKIASCSVQDQETVDVILDQGLPVIASAGANQKITFRCNAIMHCVSVYPTPLHLLNLRRIQDLKTQYLVPIGWSTHEDPDAIAPIQMAVAFGAELFERHIGLEGCNGYSSTPEQLDRWIAAWKTAKLIASGGCDLDAEYAALERVARRDTIYAGERADRCIA